MLRNREELLDAFKCGYEFLFIVSRQVLRNPWSCCLSFRRLSFLFAVSRQVLRNTPGLPRTSPRSTSMFLFAVSRQVLRNFVRKHLASLIATMFLFAVSRQVLRNEVKDLLNRLASAMFLFAVSRQVLRNTPGSSRSSHRCPRFLFAVSRQVLRNVRTSGVLRLEALVSIRCFATGAAQLRGHGHGEHLDRFYSLFRDRCCATQMVDVKPSSLESFYSLVRDRCCATAKTNLCFTHRSFYSLFRDRCCATRRSRSGRASTV